MFKGGLSRTGTEAGEQFRYFGQSDLLELFRFDPGEAARGSETQRELARMHAAQRHHARGLEQHLRCAGGGGASLPCACGCRRPGAEAGPACEINLF